MTRPATLLGANRRRAGSGFGGGTALSPLYTMYDSYTVSRTVNVNTPTGLRNALAAMLPGDDIVVAAGSYSGQYDFDQQPASMARVRFLAGVNFTGGAAAGGTPVAAWHITGRNMILTGPADIINLAWNGILLHTSGAIQPTNIIIQGCTIHGCGAQNVLVQHDAGDSAAGPDNCWLDGIESTLGGRSDGPVTPAGYFASGCHAVYWGDGVTNGGIINSWLHDQPNGYGIQEYQGNLMPANTNSLFAFNTITRVNGAGDGSHTAGVGAFGMHTANNKWIANVITDSFAGAFYSWDNAGVAQGNFTWNNPVVHIQDTAPFLTITDNHVTNPNLDASDRPQASSPLRDAASSYRSTYCPRTDRLGVNRTTTDPGCYQTSS